MTCSHYHPRRPVVYEWLRNKKKYYCRECETIQGVSITCNMCGRIGHWTADCDGDIYLVQTKTIKVWRLCRVDAVTRQCVHDVQLLDRKPKSLNGAIIYDLLLLEQVEMPDHFSLNYA